MTELCRNYRMNPVKSFEIQVNLPCLKFAVDWQRLGNFHGNISVWILNIPFPRHQIVNITIERMKLAHGPYYCKTERLQIDTNSNSQFWCGETNHIIKFTQGNNTKVSYIIRDALLNYYSSNYNSQFQRSYFYAYFQIANRWEVSQSNSPAFKEINRIPVVDYNVFSSDLVNNGSLSLNRVPFMLWRTIYNSHSIIVGFPGLNILAGLSEINSITDNCRQGIELHDGPNPFTHKLQIYERKK